MFELIDFVLFGLFLLVSLVTGVYHGFSAKFRKRDHSQTAEFLTGGRKLPIIPVCLSLLSTFISGIGKNITGISCLLICVIFEDCFLCLPKFTREALLGGSLISRGPWLFRLSASCSFQFSIN